MTNECLQYIRTTKAVDGIGTELLIQLDGGGVGTTFDPRMPARRVTSELRRMADILERDAEDRAGSIPAVGI